MTNQKPSTPHPPTLEDEKGNQENMTKKKSIPKPEKKVKIPRTSGNLLTDKPFFYEEDPGELKAAIVKVKQAPLDYRHESGTVIDWLNHTNRNIRIDCLKLLKMMFLPTPETLPIFTKFAAGRSLNDTDFQEKDYYVRLVAMELATECLRSELDPDMKTLRLSAVEALLNIVRDNEEEDHIRGDAVKYLGQCGIYKEKIVEKLTPYKDYEALREEVSEAISQLSD